MVVSTMIERWWESSLDLTQVRCHDRGWCRNRPVATVRWRSGAYAVPSASNAKTFAMAGESFAWRKSELCVIRLLGERDLVRVRGGTCCGCGGAGPRQRAASGLIGNGPVDVTG
jgi:hypothetical protein